MFVDHLLLWLHIGFAIFTIGPLTITMMTTPRFIRSGDVSVVRFLHRNTRLYALLSLAVFVVGAGQAARGNIFDQTWVSVSMTLFVVALVLIFAIVEPDQRRAVKRMQESEEAAVQTGRIGAVAGVVSALWLVILVLMVWQP